MDAQNEIIGEKKKENIIDIKNSSICGTAPSRRGGRGPRGCP